MNNASEVDSEREISKQSKKRSGQKEENQIKRLDIVSLSLQREGMGYTITSCIYREKT